MKRRIIILLLLSLSIAGCGTVKKTEASEKEHTEAKQTEKWQKDSTTTHIQIQNHITAGQENYLRQTEIRFDPTQKDSMGHPAIIGITITETEQKNSRCDHSITRSVVQESQSAIQTEESFAMEQDHTIASQERTHSPVHKWLFIIGIGILAVITGYLLRRIGIRR